MSHPSLRSAIAVALALSLIGGTFKLAALLVLLGEFGGSRLLPLAVACPLVALPVIGLTVRFQLLRSRAHRSWYQIGLITAASASFLVFFLTSVCIHGLVAMTACRSWGVAATHYLTETVMYVLYAASSTCLLVDLSIRNADTG